MIRLPAGFAATYYPGYFWNCNDQKLYSLKRGTLTPLYRYHPGPWSDYDGYKVSNKGVQRYLPIKYLRSLSPAFHDVMIPMNDDSWPVKPPAPAKKPYPIFEWKD